MELFEREVPDIPLVTASEVRDQLGVEAVRTVLDISDRALLAEVQRRGLLAKKPPGKPRLIVPFPVYVATFRGGEVTRFSLHCWQNQPLPFERGRRIACQAIANERAAARYGFGVMVATFPPATDITAGHFEVGNVIHPDPYFSGRMQKPRDSGANFIQRSFA